MLRIRLQLKTNFFYSFFLIQKIWNLSTFFYFITFTENYRSIVTFFPRKNQFTKNTKKSQPNYFSTTELQFFWDTNYWNYNFKIHWTSVFVFLLWAPSSKKDISKNIIISSWIQKKNFHKPNLGFQQKKDILLDQFVNKFLIWWCSLQNIVSYVTTYSYYNYFLLLFYKKEVKKSYLELWTNYPSLLLFDTTFSTVWREK